jgi:hypothetical protein
MLLILVGIPLFAFFNVITGGLFIYLFAIALGLGALGSVHYFLWGRSLNKEVAGERREEACDEGFAPEDWDYGAPDGPPRVGPL